MSERRKRILAKLLATLMIIAATVGSGFYFFVIQPSRKLNDLLMSDNPSDKELRQAAHHALRFYPHHDSLIVLMRSGDETSIPILIRSLHRMPKEQLERGIVVCTFDHCRDALKRITNQDFGYDADKWESWHKAAPTRP